MLHFVKRKIQCPFLPSYLPLSDQLPLQMIELEEGAIGADGADWPDRPHRPPGRPGEDFNFFCYPILEPAASVNVTAAHGERFIQAVI